VLGAIAQGLGGERITGTEAYVLYGCVETDLGAGNFSYTAGWIMHGTNAECYYMAAIASIAISTAPVLTITTTPDATADPTTFTDGSSQNVHDVRTLVLTDGALNSADINYDDLIFVNKTWQSYTPTFSAYTSADVAVGGGVTMGASSVGAYWMVKNNTLFLDIKGVDMSTIATVRYVTISLPVTTLINGKAKRGNSFCRFMVAGGSGSPLAASVDLSSGGAGSAFEIRKADNTDFGVLNNYDFRFSIAIALI